MSIVSKFKDDVARNPKHAKQTNISLQLLAHCRDQRLDKCVQVRAQSIIKPSYRLEHEFSAETYMTFLKTLPRTWALNVLILGLQSRMFAELSDFARSRLWIATYGFDWVSRLNGAIV